MIDRPLLEVWLDVKRLAFRMTLSCFNATSEKFVNVLFNERPNNNSDGKIALSFAKFIVTLYCISYVIQMQPQI